MNLRKIEIAPDHDLTYELFLADLGDHEVLVMRFSGTYGAGSDGNGDAAYMLAMTKAALSFVYQIKGLIFDLSAFNYLWGDALDAVFYAGMRIGGPSNRPIAIVVSDGCEEAITSLLVREMDIEDLSLLTHSLQEALDYLATQIR